MSIRELKNQSQKLGVHIDESEAIHIDWSKIPFSEADRPYWAALSAIDGIGPATLPVLVAGFGSAQAVLTASRGDYIAAGLSQTVVDRIQKRPGPAGPGPVEQWFEKIIHPSYGISLSFIVPSDSSFPKALLSLDYGPSQLWGWGDIELLNNAHVIAVVGTRKVTPYGKSVTEMIGRDLARRGVTVVSGLMYGVDEVAMRSAIQAGGKTIGVWAGGITLASLTSRWRLAKDVVDHGGVVVSEFAPTLFPSKGTFPARNRIVAGLSKAVVVTEGASDSGSLITARNAVEQGRPVGAVPGPITSVLSAGTNELLKLGATPVTNAEDVLLMCGIDSSSSKTPNIPYTPKSPNESAILKALGNHSMTADELSREAKLSVAVLGELLTSLELVGVIRQSGEDWEMVR